MASAANQPIEDIVIRIRPFSLISYRSSFVVLPEAVGEALFIDETDRVLVEFLRSPVTFRELTRCHYEHFGKYGFRAVVSLVGRLLQASMLEDAARTDLLRHDMFQPFKPSSQSNAIVPFGFAPVARLIGPVVRLLDSWPAIVAAVLCLGYAVYECVSRATDMHIMRVGGNFSWGAVVWAVAVMGAMSAKNAFKYALLVARGCRPARSGIHFRHGIPCFNAGSSGIVAMGWPAAFRASLAVLLFPAVLSALCLAVGMYDASSTVFAIACLMILFLELSPFFRSDASDALERWTGKPRQADISRGFVWRKFATSLLRFRADFRDESRFIGFAICSILWMYVAYLAVSLAFDRYFTPLNDAIFLEDRPAERIGAGVFVLGILFPLFGVFGAVIRLVSSNLYHALERPIHAVRSRLVGLLSSGPKLSASDKRAFIDQVPLFSSLPPESRDRLAEYVESKYFPAGRVMVWQGTEGDAFYTIYSGRVEVAQEDPTGETRRLAALSKKDSFGEMALIEKTPRTATVRALEPTVCLVLRADVFDQYFAGHTADRDAFVGRIRRSAALNRIPLFADLPPESTLRIMSGMSERSAANGESILNEGDAAEEFYILLSGSVAVWSRRGQPGESKIATLGSGDYFGEMALFDDKPRSATVVAAEPCRLLVMPKSSFLEILHSSVRAGAALEETVRLRAAAS